MRRFRAPRFAAPRMFGHTGNEGNTGNAACTLRETTDTFYAGFGARHRYLGLRTGAGEPLRRLYAKLTLQETRVRQLHAQGGASTSLPYGQQERASGKSVASPRPAV